jgi:uncharacterized membrane protein
MDKDKPDLQEIAQTLQDVLRRLDRVERRTEQLSGQRGNAAEHSSRSLSALKAERNDLHANRDFESRIGMHWLNRVGIVALLVGVSLFLKFAFEGWVGASGRVSIGLIAGTATILGSEWFRIHAYRIFSFSLKALGLGVLYLSLWAAFQVYNLIPWAVAFMAMVTVTASAGALAVWQSSEILALFALVGGFATPVLLYTGQSREIQLFSYLALLNTATLVLAGYGVWRRLLLFSVVATEILFFSWYAIFYKSGQLTPTFAFATAFLIIFALAPLAQSVVRPEASTHSKILILASLLNPSCYFLALYLMLGRNDRTRLTWCAVALAGAYGIVGRFLFKVGSITTRTLQQVHLVLSTAFITLAIAVYFGSLGISVGWFIQAAALMTIGFWRRSAFARWQALILITLAIAKVFVYDVWSLQEEYRIVSFFLLGILLLVVSFIYQRDWLKL